MPMRRVRSRRLLVVSAAAVLAAVLAVAAALAPTPGVHPAAAAGTYRHGITGYDVSWPQCGRAYPPGPFGFAIVGVNGGHMFTNNPCLASEYQWAKQGTERAPSVYINTSYGTLRGGCHKSNVACQAYTFGYAAAQSAYTYARSQGVTARTWWLDVETGNIWTSNTWLNAEVLRGSAAALRRHRLTVGIYCTPFQWGIIAGGYRPGLPVWAAGAPIWNPALYCSAAKSVGGGPVWITQDATWLTDFDYSC
jgi:hypothetical protein